MGELSTRTGRSVDLDEGSKNQSMRADRHRDRWAHVDDRSFESRRARDRVARSRWILPTIVLALGCASEPATPPPQVADDPVSIESARLHDLALDRWVDRSVELQRVNQRLRIAGRSLCRRHNVPVLGAAVQDLSTLPPAIETTAQRRFGGGEGLVVLSVFPEAGSAGSVLAVGDRILRIDGRRISSIGDLNLETGPVVALEVQRGDARPTLEVEVTRGCGFPARLVASEEVNANANGESVAVFTGFIREMDDVNILAAVVGHELAHNIGGDSRSLHTRQIHREARADHMGFYLAAMAGYPISTDADLYIKLERNINTLTDRSQSHPVTTSRVAAMRKTLEEIEQMLSAGLPLIPEP